jgi:Xaa-Pro aminopeptidase
VAGWSVFPAPTYLGLTRGLPDATVGDASEITTRMRMVKTPDELELMRVASRISDDAMKAGLAEIKAGATEEQVASAAYAAIREAGAEPSFVIEMGSGPRTALGTFLPGPRVFEEGKLAVLDCGARVHGYHGDMARTVPVSTATAEQASMLEAVERSVEAAIAAVAPGVTVGEVRDAAAESIRESGYGEYWWDAFMPHGNGVQQHEPPDARNNPDLPLEVGMVLCIEPGITTPEHGAVIIEQMITVGPDGAEVMNQVPTDVWRNGR